MLIPAIRAISLLALPLLVPRVLADHEDRAVAADDLALLAHRLDRGSYLLDPFRLRVPRRRRLWPPQGGGRYRSRTCVCERRTAIYDSRGIPAASGAGNAAGAPMNGSVQPASRRPTTEPVRDISMTTRASLPGGLRTAIVPRCASTVRAARISALRPVESMNVVPPRSRTTSRQPSSSARPTASSSFGAVPMSSSPCSSSRAVPSPWVLRMSMPTPYPLGGQSRPPQDDAAPSSWCHGVRIRGPSAVIATVNSKWAASEPSWE